MCVMWAYFQRFAGIIDNDIHSPVKDGRHLMGLACAMISGRCIELHAWKAGLLMVLCWVFSAVMVVIKNNLGRTVIHTRVTSFVDLVSAEWHGSNLDSVKEDLLAEIAMQEELVELVSWIQS